MGFPSGSVIKKEPAMQEPYDRWFPSLGWEDPLEEGMATDSSILTWYSYQYSSVPWTESLTGYSSWGRRESHMTEATWHAHTWLFADLLIHLHYQL